MKPRHILNILSPRPFVKAMMTMDRSTAAMIGAFWLAAVVTAMMAMFAVNGAVAVKQHSADVVAQSVRLPTLVIGDVNPDDLPGMIEKIQQRFPDIQCASDQKQSLILSSHDGGKFRQWIAALGYVERLDPRYQWTISAFCVGSCGNQDIMKATVSGRQITLAVPNHHVQETPYPDPPPAGRPRQ